MFDDPNRHLTTFDVDFIVKHPSQVTHIDRPVARHVYEDAIVELLAGHRILTATDWKRSPNSKSFRPPNEDDRHALVVAVKAVLAALDHAFEESFPQNTDYVVISDLTEDLRFGCVSGKLRRIVLIGGLGASSLAALAAADATWRGDVFRRPNVSMSCSTYITTPQEVAHHMRTQLRYENPKAFDPSDTACVALRQTILKHAGASELVVDGKYGDKTVRAERDIAKRLNINSDDLLALYETLSAAHTRVHSARRKRP